MAAIITGLFTVSFIASAAAAEDLALTIVYDNNSYAEGLETQWGFSCLVRGPERTLLFDTGGDGSVLLSNMGKLKIDPEEVDVVVLSHIHGDHVGGLSAFLERNPSVTVYLPKSFPESFKDKVKAYGAKPVEIHEPVEICRHVYSTGELGTAIREQSLVIHTTKGLVVVTGCAHPGVVNIVEKARDMLQSRAYLVMGGFHLSGTSSERIGHIVAQIEALGVEKVAPCHCSGDVARRMFKEVYKDHFIPAGVGMRLEIKEAFEAAGKEPSTWGRIKESRIHE